MLSAACLAIVRPAAAQETVQQAVVSSHYVGFRTEQIHEARSMSVEELARSRNIFYLSVDAGEWARLEELVSAYFDAMEAYGFRADRLERLVRELKRYKVTVDACNPIGYYSLWQKRVYLDTRLFHPGANADFTLSVLYHEKIHENQIRLLDSRALSIDQKQRYWDKLQEIGAHYNQIRYVLLRGNEEALQMTLANSGQEKMFPNLLKYYPRHDPVVRAILVYAKKDRQLLVASGRSAEEQDLQDDRAGLADGGLPPDRDD